MYTRVIQVPYSVATAYKNLSIWMNVPVLSITNMCASCDVEFVARWFETHSPSSCRRHPHAYSVKQTRTPCPRTYVTREESRFAWVRTRARWIIARPTISRYNYKRVNYELDEIALTELTRENESRRCARWRISEFPFETASHLPWLLASCEFDFRHELTFLLLNRSTVAKEELETSTSEPHRVARASSDLGAREPANRHER